MMMFFNKLLVGSTAVWLATAGIVDSRAAEMAYAGEEEETTKTEMAGAEETGKKTAGGEAAKREMAGMEAVGTITARTEAGAKVTTGIETAGKETGGTLTIRTETHRKVTAEAETGAKETARAEAGAKVAAGTDAAGEEGDGMGDGTWNGTGDGTGDGMGDGDGTGGYSQYSRYSQQEVHFRAPGVPREMVFAGDTVRFGRSDLYERMDRELISFTYMHSNSILMLKKSDRYFGQVEPILKRFGIPDDLKYLMAIESNLNPKAYSSAGAAGLWQFTKATGKEYGLIIDGEVDERYNIEKETEAACKYLKRAYEKYGDWMTVAASYNAGQGGISRRLEGQRQKSALNLWMVEETSRYMFRVLAAKMFFENPEAFGFRVEMFEKYPYRSPKEVVTISGAIADLVDFAEEHGVSYFQLKEANLWLRDSKLLNKSGHTYRIIIPDGK